MNSVLVSILVVCDGFAQSITAAPPIVARAVTPGLTPQQTAICQVYLDFDFQVKNVKLSQAPVANQINDELTIRERDAKVLELQQALQRQVQTVLGDGGFRDWSGILAIGNIGNQAEENALANSGHRQGTLHDSQLRFSCPGRPAVDIIVGVAGNSIPLDAPVIVSMRSIADGSAVRAEGKIDFQTSTYVPDASPHQFATSLGFDIVFAGKFTSFTAQVPQKVALTPGTTSGYMINVDSSEQELMLVSRITPTYSPMIRVGSPPGPVRFTVIIQEDGTVYDAKLISGEADLVAAAKAALGKWRYKTRFMSGTPVRVRTEVSVTFRPE
jgi:hypothetical protein